MIDLTEYAPDRGRTREAQPRRMRGWFERGRWLSALSWLKTQVWLVPLVTTVAFCGLAVALLSAGSDLFHTTTPVWWLYSGDAQTARDLLATILSGLITMTSVVLSMTFVAVSLAANQLGPRLVTILTNDRQIQLVLGLFVGTVVYVMIVFRTLDDTLGKNGVPHAAVSGASALVLVCLLALLFYVHKISRMIISDVVVESVAADLMANLDDVLLDEGRPTPDPDLARADLEDVTWLALGRAGYVRTIDYENLRDVARSIGGRIHVPVRPGHFLLAGEAYAGVHAAAELSDETMRHIADAFVVGAERSPAQDLEYTVRQLVEGAVRALSPSINDPFTAITVIDKLAQAIEAASRDRALPRRVMKDADQEVRVIASVIDVSSLVNSAFDPIRRSGASHVTVLAHVANTLAKLLSCGPNPEAEIAIRRQLEKLEQTARASIEIERDLTACLERIDAALTQKPVAAHRPQRA